MTQEISLNEFRRLNKTRLMLGVKEIRDRFASRQEIRKALTNNRTILESHESRSESLDDYDVDDEFRRRSCIEVYKEGEHNTQKQFQLELDAGRVNGESYRILMADFIVNGELKQRLFIK